MKFKELKLEKVILDAVEKIGFTEVTPIQEQAIPEILKKKDLIGLAQTGTGKTAAFGLPIIDMLIREKKLDKKTRVLIVSPTRELAIQIRDNILDYSQGTDLRCGVVLGGVNQSSQKTVLQRGVDILVATPGRLVDLINQRIANISNVEILVLDEADTMLDMGFIRDIKFIIGKTLKERQTLLFSATINNEVKELSKQFMKDPIIIKTKTDEITANNIEQELYYVDSTNKVNLLLELLSTKEQKTTLIFTRTKHGANKLAERLSEFNLKTSVIHGNKTQSNRVKALNDFKTGKTKIMIATDIAARGIDIVDLGLVINYDIPEKNEIYIHRIGRTARAGKEGKAITLCTSADLNNIKDIEKLINHKIKVMNHKYTMVLKEVKPQQKHHNDTKKKYPNNKPNNSSNLNKKPNNKKYYKGSK
ncbi:MAG: DEAD/DEAH box helicase [Bacilli bacterium]|nr:DEAD/DEAH box helicase [Bacilli bacterium]